MASARIRGDRERQAKALVLGLVYVKVTQICAYKRNTHSFNPQIQLEKKAIKTKKETW